MTTLSPTNVESVTVIGAGSMGHGIAQTFATSGYAVTLVDVDKEPLAKALENIKNSLERFDEDVETILNRIDTTTDRNEGLTDADVMVEAVPESMEIKEEVFSDADEVLPENAVLATNTSTLPVTEIATATDRPERVVGMHFSNPVPLMDIVEVISGEETSDDVFAFAEALSEDLEKSPVLVAKDVPGFILNRVNYAFWSEALRHVDEGDEDIEAIDAAVQRLDFPMGPFEVLDFAGIDVFYMVCQSMQKRGVPVHISDTHEECFETGRYGMKTGAGFYDYPEAGAYARIDLPLERRFEFDPYPLIASSVNAAAWLIDSDVSTAEDIDTAMEIGMSWPRGPLAFADEYGIDRIVSVLDGLYDKTGWEQYEPHSLLRDMVAASELGWETGSGFYEYSTEHESYGNVEYARTEFVATITFSRPEKMNAMDKATWQGLRSALERARNDATVRATILRGAGSAFSAGDDIAEMADWETVAESSEYYDEHVFPVLEEFRAHPTPTIALVNGTATGMGCELVLLSDMAVAASGSRFGQPEGTIGTIAPIWLAHGMTDVGTKKVMELAMTGDLVSSAEAADMGLVNYTVSAGQASDVARELARSTTASAPNSIEAIKAVRRDQEAELKSAWTDQAVDDFFELLQMDAAQHGLSAFLNNEPPRWKH